MNNDKYVGFDVHLATIVVVVLNEAGKCIMESVIETKGNTIIEFIRGLSGTVHVIFEEGTQSTWLYDLLKPRVAEVVVCNARRHQKQAGENHADRIDANKLANQLRMGEVKAVYKGDQGLRTLKELVHSYNYLVRDVTRVMNRIKAIYRGRGIGCRGRRVYQVRGREEWLKELKEPGLRRRAELLYRELDELRGLRREAKRAMLGEARRHKASEVVQRVPAIGPVRAAQILAVVMTPHRFRTKRQFWSYCGFGVVTHSTAQYDYIDGKLEKRKRRAMTRGLNRNHNHQLKEVFKNAALEAMKEEELASYYQEMVSQGTRPEMARLNVARKLAAITLAVWKSEGEYNKERVSKQEA
jgi:transposase